MAEQEENLIAYCSLYCGECFSYKGQIADLARDLRKELRESKFEKTAEFLSALSFFQVFQHYPQCYDVLGAFVKLRCKYACKGGGGNPTCKIRKCCQKKGFAGCWECEEVETCAKLDFLIPAHGDAHRRNLRILQKKGIEPFLTGKKFWYTKPEQPSGGKAVQQVIEL